MVCGGKNLERKKMKEKTKSQDKWVGKKAQVILE